MNNEREKNRLFFERSRTIRLLWVLLYAVCGLTLVTEFFMDREPHFGIDGFFGFYSVLGFVACAVLILFAKVIGYILKRKEGYYD